MRWIRKRSEPPRFTQWRAANQAGPNYAYALVDAELRQEIRQALVCEQGGLCAYTGRRITDTSCHIEHLRPQVHCRNGEDVHYGNMVGCVPAPNAPGLPYGAHKKGAWPNREEEPLFVSPLRAGCEGRFSFSLSGDVRASDPADVAAERTIDKLGLNDGGLQDLRRAAIEATLGGRGRQSGSLDLRRARLRLNCLAAAERDRGLLEPFCFVLKQALQKHIDRVEAIRRSRGERR